MLLVIFGAGASHDSSTNDVPRQPRSLAPPLAKDLLERHFDHVAARFPASRPIINRLRISMDGDDPTSLEIELARVADESGGSAEGRQQLIAFRFYLHRVIEDTVKDWLDYTAGFTHYLTLLDYLRRWHQRTGIPVRLATFNYDLLLDRAAQDVVTGWNFSGDIPAYVGRHDFQLFKLHGSTDWSRVIQAGVPITTPMVSGAMDLVANSLLPEGVIEASPPREHVAHDGAVTLPAMAIPMAAKTDFECPRGHLLVLQSTLPEVTRLLIVGWRGAEPHAISLLEGSRQQEGLMPGYALGIVTGSPQGSAEVKTNLGLPGAKGRLILDETEGFSSFIEELDAHMARFLSAGQH